MQTGDVTWSAELRFHGEYGVEAQLWRNGEFFAGRRFDTKEQASAYADAERRMLIDQEGWSAPGDGLDA